MKLFILLLCALPCFGGYNGYRSFTLDHTKVGASDSTGFTVLVSGTWAEFATVANGGKVQNTVSCGVNSITCPADLIFTSDATCATPLSWEIETYTTSTGALIAWVKVGTLSHSVNTLIYGCVGNAAVVTFQGGSTGAAFDANTAAVWHLPNGSTLSAKDSSANANNGTITGTSTAVAGQVDGAQSFNGSTYDALSASATLNISGPITLSAWVKGGTAGVVIGGYNPVSPFNGYAFGIGGAFGATANKLNYWNGAASASGTVTVTDNTWHYVVISVTGTAASFYSDGTLDVTRSIAVPSSYSGVRRLGEATDGTGQLIATVDEIKIASINRSADWITAEYNNQNSPSTFYAVGAFTPLATSGSKMLLLGAQ